MTTHRVGLRDAGLRRLRRITAAAVAGAGALVLVVGGVAARAFPGRSARAQTPARVSTPVPAPAAGPPAQSAPPLVSAGSLPQPAPAQAPPAPTDAPPVVVSGGS